MHFWECVLPPNKHLKPSPVDFIQAWNSLQLSSKQIHGQNIEEAAHAVLSGIYIYTAIMLLSYKSFNFRMDAKTICSWKTQTHIQVQNITLT